MAELSNQNNPVRNHEAPPPMVLKGYFVYHIFEKHKKKLNLWPKVINMPKEGHYVHSISEADAVSSWKLNTGTR